jgi:hypothetical protein
MSTVGAAGALVVSWTGTCRVRLAPLAKVNVTWTFWDGKSWLVRPTKVIEAPDAEAPTGTEWLAGTGIGVLAAAEDDALGEPEVAGAEEALADPVESEADADDPDDEAESVAAGDAEPVSDPPPAADAEEPLGESTTCFAAGLLTDTRVSSAVPLFSSTSCSGASDPAA